MTIFLTPQFQSTSCPRGVFQPSHRKLKIEHISRNLLYDELDSDRWAQQLTDKAHLSWIRRRDDKRVKNLNTTAADDFVDKVKNKIRENREHGSINELRR